MHSRSLYSTCRDLGYAVAAGLLAAAFGYGLSVADICADPGCVSVSRTITVMGYYSQGTITNTSEEPIRIRAVFCSRDSERTLWVAVLQPSQSRPLRLVNEDNGFHVYTLSGIEIDWLRIKVQ